LLQQAFQGASEALMKPKGQHCLPVIIKADSCVWEGQSVTFMLVQNVAQTRKDRDALRLYHAAAEACLNIVALLDLSGAVAYANYALCRMLGYARPEERLRRLESQLQIQRDKLKKKNASASRKS